MVSKRCILCHPHIPLAGKVKLSLRIYMYSISLRGNCINYQRNSKLQSRVINGTSQNFHFLPGITCSGLPVLNRHLTGEYLEVDQQQIQNIFFVFYVHLMENENLLENIENIFAELDAKFFEQICDRSILKEEAFKNLKL